MCSPTAVLVTNVPMPASVLPNHSRAKGGLTRSGVRSMRCDRRVAGAGASGPGGTSVTERNYATARSPDVAWRHASTSRSREPSRTHTHRSSAVRRATWVRTVPSAVVEVVMARPPVTTARAVTPAAGAPTAPRAPAANAAANAERMAVAPAASRPRGRLTTASAAYNPTMPSRSPSATQAAKRDSRASGAPAPTADGCAVVVMGHTVPPATDSPTDHTATPRTVLPAGLRADPSARPRQDFDAETRSDLASGLAAGSAVFNGQHVVSPTPRHLRVQRQHLQVPHGSRHPPAPRRRRRHLGPRPGQLERHRRLARRRARRPPHRRRPRGP